MISASNSAQRNGKKLKALRGQRSAFPVGESKV